MDSFHGQEVASGKGATESCVGRELYQPRGRLERCMGEKHLESYSRK